MPEENADQTPAEEVEQQTATEASINPSEMSDDDLNKTIAQMEEGISMGDFEVDDGGEEEDEVVEPTEDEPVEAVEEETEEEQKPAEEEKAEKVDEPDSLDLLKQEYETRIQAEQAEREKWEYLAQHRQGELNHIKQMQQRLAEAPTGTADDYQEAAPSADALRSVIREEVADLRGDRVADAIQQEGALFIQRHTDHDQYVEAMQPRVQKAVEANQEFLTGDNPKLARVVTKSILESAYAEARVERLQQLRQEAEKRRADQAAGLVEKKKAAAISRSDGGAVPVRRAPKSAKDMSMDELRAEIRRQERA